jgi:hypothetical protein
MSFIVKFNYNGIYRRVSIDYANYTVIEKAARDLYSIPINYSVCLTWTDDEGDNILMSSEAEFQEFYRNANINFNKYQTRLVKCGIIAKPFNEVIPEFSVAKEEQTDVVHDGVTCDECGMSPIIGIRYKCTLRDNFDLCSTCEQKGLQPFPMLKIYSPDAHINIKAVVHGDGNHLRCPYMAGLSSTVQPGCNSEEILNNTIHYRVSCDECGMKPIIGIRYKCTVRDNFDLCSTCEAKVTQPYPMLKIYTPDIGTRLKGWHHHGWNGWKSCRRGHGHTGCSPDAAGKGRRQSNNHNSTRPRNGRFADTLSSVSEAAKTFAQGTARDLNDAVNIVSQVAKAFVDDVEEQILQEALFDSQVESSNTTTNNTVAATTASTSSATATAAIASGAVEMNIKDVKESTVPSTNDSFVVRGYALKPMARFVGDETVPDASVLPPSTNFIKIWRIRNDGPCEWPQGVKLITAGGDPMCDASMTTAVDSICVGQESRISVTLKTPPVPGRYVSYFRLQAPDGITFGQKLWVDIRVRSEQQQQQSMFTSPYFNGQLSENQPSSMMSAFDQLSISEKSIPSFMQSLEENKIPMQYSDESNRITVPGIMIPMVPPPVQFQPPVPEAAKLTEDQLWELNRVELENEWNVELVALRSMGFYDTRRNIQLLQRYVKTSFVKFPQLQGKPFNDTLSVIVDSLLRS